MKRLLVSVILGVGLLFFAAQAYAYIVNYEEYGSDRLATAITGLTVGSLGTYDVVFRYGTPSTLAFNNFVDAKAAADAINGALTSSAITYVANTTSTPWDVWDYYEVPYEYYYGDYRNAYSRYTSGWSTQSGSFTVTPSFMFAVLTPSTPVPIPAAVWLLGSGLIGLIGVRRFRK